jgi:hypothetical protein
MELDNLNKLKESIQITKNWIDLHKYDIYKDKFYYYHPVNSPHLLREIRSDYKKWKNLCEVESKNKFTLMREFDISKDSDDFNFFIIADTSKIDRK